MRGVLIGLNAGAFALNGALASSGGSWAAFSAFFAGISFAVCLALIATH